MSIRQINPRAESARRHGRAFVRSVEHHLREHGDTFAGYAVVTWDHRGNCVTGLFCDGPISRNLAPSYVRDAIQRHVTLDMVQDTACTLIPAT